MQNKSIKSCELRLSLTFGDALPVECARFQVGVTVLERPTVAVVVRTAVRASVAIHDCFLARMEAKIGAKPANADQVRPQSQRRVRS